MTNRTGIPKDQIDDSTDTLELLLNLKYPYETLIQIQHDYGPESCLVKTGNETHFEYVEENCTCQFNNKFNI